MNNEFDLVVIGGGINGVGIAADAAGRGLRVLLCEQGDLASATSSNSSKLIHGGLRYLEHYEFSLVRKSLAEREVLLKKAPHIISPLRFCLPHRPHLRPAWMIRSGLFLYDHLAKRQSLGGSQPVDLKGKGPLQDDITQGFEYSDAWVDDARLVVLNALCAANHGAQIRTRTRCERVRRMADRWQVTLTSVNTQARETIVSKGVVNATGPWVESWFDKVASQPSPQQIRLVKGSHIVVPKFYPDPQAYILQNEDGRIVFVIPYEQDFTLIGTTDEDYEGDPGQAKISQQEIDYLLEVCNQHFEQNIRADQVVHDFCGVRPLLEDESGDAQKVTRDYRLTLKDIKGRAPLLSVFGGKITTYRTLAKKAVNKLKGHFPHMARCQTKKETLPGGDFSTREALAQQLSIDYPWLEPGLCARWVRSYGTLSRQILEQHTQKNKDGLDSLGLWFGGDLYQAEVDYLCRCEWAQNCEDILWRRTKQGLRFTQEQRQRLGGYVSDYTRVEETSAPIPRGEEVSG